MGATFAFMLWLGAMALPVAAVGASAPAWFNEPYPYVLIEQDVRKAMEAFGQQLNLPLVFSDRVRGPSRGVVRATEAGEFLDNLCTANGLVWYFDGGVLYLYSDEELATRLFHSGNGTAGQLRQYLAGLPVTGRGLSVRDGSGNGELLIAGPPAYLALVQAHLDQAQRPRPSPPRTASQGVRVYRGNTMTQAQ